MEKEMGPRQATIDNFRQRGLSQEELEEQLDNHGEGFFRRVWRGIKEHKILLALPLAAGLIYAGAWTNENVLKREVTPLVWYDRNQDGIQDAVVAFPIKGTGHAIMKWIDGKTLSDMNISVPNQPVRFNPNSKGFNIHYMKTEDLPLKFVDDFYNSRLGAMHAFIDKKGEQFNYMKQYREYWQGTTITKIPEIKKPKGDLEELALFLAEDFGSTIYFADLE